MSHFPVGALGPIQTRDVGEDDEKGVARRKRTRDIMTEED